MGTITEPYKIKNGWAVKITRKNNTFYETKSEDLQSIIDYREEFLAERQKRLLQSQKTVVR